LQNLPQQYAPCHELLCAQVFITPMPLLRVAHALGLPHLRNLDEAVSIMRGAMLDVIQVWPRLCLALWA
jgi:hypothetical protein